MINKISDKKFNLILLTIVVISILPRLIFIDQNLLDIQPFRQTQTAITVWTYTQDGFNFFNYQTPIFGPPYQAPFELPVFQATAYLFIKLGISNIEIACRLTNIIFFLICCFFIVSVCSKIFKNRLITSLALIHFCFLPFSICWSRNVTIEYCSIAFCLFYVYAFLKLLNVNGLKKYLFLILITVIGCLAYSIKLTTAFPYVIIVFTFFGIEIIKHLSTIKNDTFFNVIFSKKTFEYIIYSGFIFIVPIIAMYLWVRHTDLLKMQSSFSYITTSSSLRIWNFGTWEDKTNFSNWHIIFERIGFAILPFTLVGLTFLTTFKKSTRHLYVRFLFLISVVFITIFTFFNLYFEHDYYLVALLPIFSVLFAIGVYLSYEFFKFNKLKISKYINIAAISMGLIIPFSLTKGMTFSKEYLRFSYTKNKNDDYPQYLVGKRIQALTKKSDAIIITDFEWSSEMMYYAKRKGLMWTLGNENEIGRFEKDLARTQYKFIVSKNPELYPNLFSKFEICKKISFNEYTIFYLK